MTYASGTQKMLEVALKAISRHDAGVSAVFRLIVDSRDALGLKEAGKFENQVEIRSYDVGIAASGSGQHGRLLDRAIKDVNTEYTLMLDSDCFPVADGWLRDLVWMLKADVRVIASGIRWAWIPPFLKSKEDMKTFEWRIRGFHNSDNLQPACQLVRTEQFLERGYKLADADGDDTNHGFMKKARADGYKIDGWNTTRCALPDIEFDTEMNRHESLIYGDKVYHHVGATRELRENVHGKPQIFQKARERVYLEGGAEWMLQPGNSYIYKHDREEDAACFKMNMMYREMRIFLETHGCLFSNDWA